MVVDVENKCSLLLSVLCKKAPNTLGGVHSLNINPPHGLSQKRLPQQLRLLPPHAAVLEQPATLPASTFMGVHCVMAVPPRAS